MNLKKKFPKIPIVTVFEGKRLFTRSLSQVGLYIFGNCKSEVEHNVLVVLCRTTHAYVVLKLSNFDVQPKSSVFIPCGQKTDFIVPLAIC